MIMAMARRLDDADLKGRLLLLPVANPYSFAVGSRQNPVDDVNLNRVFPGLAGGWFSEQWALFVLEQFLGKIDVLIDIHAGGAKPTVDYTYIFNDEKLSRAFGTKLLYRPEGGVSLGTIYGGTLSSIALERKIPTVTPRAGRRAGRPGAVHRARLRRLSTCCGGRGAGRAPQARADQVVMIAHRHHPSEGGRLPALRGPALGEPDRLGAVLGRVVSPYTFEELELIRNPLADGWMVLAHLTENLVQPGDYGYMVGQE